MLKNEDVVALAGLFNLTAEDVNQAIEKGTVSEIISSFLPTVKIYKNEDFSTFTENLKRQAIAELDKNKLPSDIYNYVKGSVLEKTERELAKQYGVTEVGNLNGLVEEILKTKTNSTPNEEVKLLKQRIVDIESEFNGKLTSERKSFETKFIDTELNRAIGELPIDAEGDKLGNQQEIVRAMLKTKFDFTIDNGIPVAMKDGKLVVDSKLDPVPIKDVIYGFAKDYVNLRPEQGGRGDSSSANVSRKIDFSDYCQKNNIRPNSTELVKAKRELEAKGYTLT